MTTRTPQTKDLALAIKTVDGARRRIVGRASQEIEDHMGDVIVARGIDTRTFLQNPVLLADHDRAFILGRVLRLWLASPPEGDALMFEAEVLPAGTSARIDERWAAIQGGAANGISIGFIGTEMEQRQASGGRVGLRYTKTTLLELSQVALPACSSCLIEQRACPHGDGDEPVLLVLDDAPPAQRRPVWRSWESRSEPVVWIDDAWKMCPPNPGVFGHEPDDAPWSAPALKDFTDTPWAELSAEERKAIGRCFAFAENWPPETYGDLHLPHHDPKGHDVNLHACRNALARLTQVQGMSAEDRAAAKAHLEAHVEAFKKMLVTFDERDFRAALDAVVRDSVVATFRKMRGLVD